MERRLMSVTMEGLIRTVAPSLTPEWKPRFKSAGVDPDSPQKVIGYTTDEWNAAVDLSASLLFPALPHADASYELGRKFTRVFMEGTAGKTLLELIKIIGPQKTIERTAENLKTGNPFLSVLVTRVSATEYDVHVSWTGNPDFTRGLIEESVRLAGAKDLTSRVLNREGEAATFRYRWS